VTTGPLQGWRILEVAHDVPAAFCTKILADLGADVVKVEPSTGHRLNAAPPRRADGESARFAHLSTGKRSVVADEEHDVRLGALVTEADVVVTDLAPARVDALVGPTADVSVVCIRPFGSDGPAADDPAHHLTVFHASGEGSILPSGRGWVAFPDRAPIQIGSEIAYFDAGWHAAVALLAACFDRLRGGPAQRVDVSIQESELSMNRTRLSRFNNDGVLLGREGPRYGITGMLECADGWVQVVGIREDQWDRLLESPEGEDLRDPTFETAEARAEHQAALGDALAAWCAARPKADVARIMSGIGAPAGIFADPSDLLASPQLEHREFFQEVGDGWGGTITLPGAPYRLSRTPVRLRGAPALGSAEGFADDAREDSPAPRPGRMLEGIRILDFTWAAAGPYATLLLAFLGADVVKIESSRRPDPARRGFLADYGGMNRSPNFSELNLNKRSVQVDLTQAEGLAIVQQLAGTVDVVVDNFRPGVMDRFGLGAADLLAAHLHLVVASSSANGSTGPDAMGAGLASIFAATGGVSVQTGYRDGPPTEVGESMDYRSGAALAIGILAALLHRARTGEGQHVDLSSREVAVVTAPDALLAHVTGAPWEPRLGNRHPEFAPHDVYPCADGEWLAIAVGEEHEWAGLCRALGRDEWVARYPGPEARRAAIDTLDEAIAAWTKARAARDAAASLVGAGVPASPVMTNAALAVDPHLAYREVFVDVAHPEIGVQRVMRAPWRFSEWDCRIHHAGPLLGAHTEAVVGALDGLPPLSPERAAEVFR
jgi:crotonobetainyl-CoA:carnitine CoA-transferase CaiB-like acyl-CoA transferase